LAQAAPRHDYAAETRTAGKVTEEKGAIVMSRCCRDPKNKTRPTLQTRRDTFRCSHSSSTAMPEIITSPANSAYKSQMLRFDGLINASSDKK
jgi:hypothetical protein